jgi:hypothetical protein
MTKKPKTLVDPPPRPLCMCGGPGAFKVEIDVQELVLDREAGISSRPYWSAKYRTGTRIESIMCQSCVRSNVQVQVVASAKLEKAKEVP